jgi:hypothetical protein
MPDVVDDDRAVVDLLLDGLRRGRGDEPGEEKTVVVSSDVTSIVTSSEPIRLIRSYA